ncbi:MAG: S53 family peptidase, partial [Acetobacteraceae bacterium]
MTAGDYAVFPASHREAPPGASVLGDVGADEAIEVSIYLKPRDRDAPVSADRALRAARRAELHRDDVRLLREFAAEHDLTVIAVEPARRLVRLSGPAARMEAAFRIRLQHYHDGARRFRGVSGALSLPQELHPVVESVLGLDTRPAASPRIVPYAGTAPGYLPNDVGSLYGFPGNADGSGECIGIIELSGGFRKSDLTAAFAAMGVTAPKVTAVSVDGAINSPATNPDADGEVALDIQVAGGNAPGASIAVYFAPNSEAGFTDAISTAVADRVQQPGIITISWGAPESSWSPQAIASMTSALEDAANANLSVFAAAGDSLATDGVDDGRAHVDFPASSPWAIGCGGTAITSANGAITGEIVWNNGTSGTGGGISDLFPVPGFQAAIRLPPSVNGGRSGRGVPDVAADAAPQSGYRVVVSGLSSVVGGTSAVPPLWGALIARINQQRGKPAGFFLPDLYRHANLLREVTVGDNRPAGSAVGYDAGAPWNACTGLGVPDGAGFCPAPGQRQAFG